ncbi:MAG: PorP/SprF family type IX secretion system membrane protein, partial [Bacteroidales bacterium]|nr:PorP/SprF family type IX secretion system membrane protein [Bacteroidales bacterium]
MSIFKHSLLCMLLSIASVSLYGQQEKQISHYMLNPQMFNPACAGFSNAIVASGIHRQQWYGGDGAPQTTILSLDAPLRMIQSGMGLNIVSDPLGLFLKSTTIQLTYNYQMPFAEGTLSMGLQGGMNSFGIKLVDPKVPEGLSDPTLQAL